MSLVFAWNPNNSVLDLVSYAWAGFGAAFDPLIILSLYWKAMNKNGAIAAILSGGLVVFMWKNMSGGIFDLYEIIPAFITSIFMAIFFSKLRK